MDHTDDEILIKQFIEKRNKEGFQMLILKHLKGIRRLLFGIFNGNVHDMEDAEQDILLKLYMKLHTFRFQSAFKTYLYSFVRNSAIDILRRKKRDPISIDFRNNESLIMTKNPEEELIKKERHSELMAALSRLKEEERILLIMKDVDGMSIKEIGDILDLPGGTVKSRLHRIRDKMLLILKKTLRKGGE